MTSFGGRPGALGKLAALPLARLYLWVALPAGLLFVFLNPPFGGVPDELHHYHRALALAQGELGVEASAPADYVNLLLNVSAGARKSRWAGLDEEGVRRALTVRPGPEQEAFTCRIGNAYPLGFVPQALALKLGLAVRAPPLVAFYAARLAAFLVALVLVRAAIRVAPFGKLVFALTALMPMTLQQMASLSYDALHISALFLLTAWLLALAQRSACLTGGQRAGALALAVLGSVLKPGYALVSLQAFLVPRRLFRTSGAYWGFTLGSVAACCAALALGASLFHVSFPGQAEAEAAQLAFVREHPLAFLAAVLRTTYDSAQVLWEGFVFRAGQNLETFSPLAYLLTAAALVLLLRSHEERVPLARWQRLVLLATVVAQGLLVFVPLYLVTTPVGRDSVVGVQARYFLVLVPPLVLSVYGSGFRFRSEWVRRNTPPAVLVLVLALLACALRAVWRLRG